MTYNTLANIKRIILYPTCVAASSAVASRAIAKEKKQSIFILNKTMNYLNIVIQNKINLTIVVQNKIVTTDVTL